MSICEKFHHYLDSYFTPLNFLRWRDKITPQYYTKNKNLSSI